MIPKRYLRCRRVGPNDTLAVYYNSVLLGSFVVGCDGFWCWWPELRVGAWEAYILREIADTLNRLNAPWKAQCDAYFGGWSREQIAEQVAKDRHAAGYRQYGYSFSVKF